MSLSSEERGFYASYIYDEYKSVNGVRPRWMDFDSMSDEELVSMADRLEQEIIASNSQDEQHAQMVMFAINHPRGYVTSVWDRDAEITINNIVAAGGDCSEFVWYILPEVPSFKLGSLADFI